jgi:hypothetical protein
MKREIETLNINNSFYIGGYERKERIFQLPERLSKEFEGVSSKESIQ